MKIEKLYRYPVKGLSPENLTEIAVSPGETFPGDRAFAIENGARQFDPLSPQYFPKTHFVMLQRHEDLARLATRYDPNTKLLTIFRGGKQVASGSLSTPVGRGIIEQFLVAFMGDRLNGHPHIVTCPEQPFTDVPNKWISFVNLASVRDLSRIVGQELDPLRFRANVYFDSDEPWVERNWTEMSLACGPCSFDFVHTITRCAATNVNLETAERDQNVPKSLQQAFGHTQLGYYANATVGGTVQPGMEIKLNG